MKKIILSAFLLLTGTIAICQEKTIDEVLKQLNNNSVPYILVKDVILSDSVVLLDAREPAEYAVSKIPGALYVGFYEFEIEKVKKLVADKKKKIIVYCSLGVRSERIGHKIKKAGYSNVLNLWGGIFEWKNEGGPVVDSANRPTENIHVYSKKWGAYLKKGKRVYN